jgi:DNA-binding transcriptional LysR family regulator
MLGIHGTDKGAARMARNVDLNLLTALQALLTERSVTRAAEQLGLSQPATSAALAKLRRHFGDELLTRVGHGYQLTPLATQLVERTAAAVGATQRVFSSLPDFDPASSDREFTIVMSDYVLTVLGPTLSRLLDAQAPRVRLHVEPTTKDNVDTAAESLRTTDLLVLPHGIVSDLPYQDLYQDDWACLVGADNTDVGDELTMDQLARMPWVLTYHRGTASSTAARELRTHGVELNVRMVIESYAALPALIAGTDRVALVQRQLGRIMTATHPVRMIACPFEAAPLIEALWWHPMHERDAGHQWLRQQFVNAARQIGAPDRH